MSLTDAQLRQMAETARVTLNWAMREGMKKDRQLDQIVNGFKKDLAEFDANTQTSGGPSYGG